MQQKPQRAASDKDLTYTVYGKTSTDNQSRMMCDILREMIARNPDKLNKIAEVPKKERPVYFRSGETGIKVGNAIYSIGTSYGLKDKIVQIRKAMIICEETEENISINKINIMK